MKRYTFPREPIAWIGLLLTGVLVAVDFVFHPTQTQWAHIIDMAPTVMAVIGRRQVSPTGKPLAETIAEHARKYTDQVMGARNVIDQANSALSEIAELAQAIAGAQVTPVADVGANPPADAVAPEPTSPFMPTVSPASVPTLTPPAQ